jgi:hypothetical protein
VSRSLPRAAAGDKRLSIFLASTPFIPANAAAVQGDDSTAGEGGCCRLLVLYFFINSDSPSADMPSKAHRSRSALVGST